MNKKLIGAILIIAFIGFVDAGFLAVNALKNTIPSCFIGSGCESVANSEYSKIGGIPVALIGSLYYLALLLLTVAFIDKKKEVFKKIFISFSSLGFLFSIYLVYLQLFVIEAICTYCMVSAGTSTLLFLLGIFWIKSKSLSPTPPLTE